MGSEGEGGNSTPHPHLRRFLPKIRMTTFGKGRTRSHTTTPGIHTTTGAIVDDDVGAVKGWGEGGREGGCGGSTLVVWHSLTPSQSLVERE